MSEDQQEQASAVAYLIQGGLLAAANQIASPEHGILAQPAIVSQPVGDDGDAKPYFHFILPSGIVVQVSVQGLIPEKG